jgi:DNA-binding CsgD family transcriptional regulator
MVHLIGEVAALPGGHAEKKRFLMQGLCKLIDADAWVWGLSCQRDPAKPQIYVSMMNQGFTEEAFSKFLQAVEHPEMIALASKFFDELQRDNAHITRLREQITEDELFFSSQAHHLWREADIGSLIISHRPLDDQRTLSAIGMYRRYHRERFSARECRIAHIVLTEVPWLHEQGWPEDRGVSVPALSKRQRLTLNLLTSGLSRKQIAANMSISANTVQGYIKNVYAHFGVKSQTELMNRFFQGNGHDATKT